MRGTRRTSPEIAAPLDCGDPEEDQVMSEVHLGCPPNFTGPYFSHFTFSPPPEVELMDRNYDCVRKGELTSTLQVLNLDEDGDLVLNRRNKDSKYNFAMTIQHNITSSIPSVGLQVWRAELVLGDFVLHKMFTSSDFDGIVAVELGAGTELIHKKSRVLLELLLVVIIHKSTMIKMISNTLCGDMLPSMKERDFVTLSFPGLVGMLLARVAKTVFLTDHGDEILENCVMNVHLNSGKFPASIYVRELDWKASWPPPLEKSSASQGRFGWISQELEEFQRASFLVAADVIYSDDLTDAFFRTLEILMSQNPDKVLYLALEKRYNFTLDDLSVVANGYSHFRNYLRDENECKGLENGFSQCFVGKCIDLSQIPQHVREYNRGEDVEIWQIKYERQPCPRV